MSPHLFPLSHDVKSCAQQPALPPGWRRQLCASRYRCETLWWGSTGYGQRQSWVIKKLHRQKKPHKDDMALVSHDKLHNSLLKEKSFLPHGITPRQQGFFHYDCHPPWQHASSSQKKANYFTPGRNYKSVQCTFCSQCCCFYLLSSQLWIWRNRGSQLGFACAHKS